MKQVNTTLYLTLTLVTPPIDSLCLLKKAHTRGPFEADGENRIQRPD
jgi:hypothetical protein